MEDDCRPHPESQVCLLCKSACVKSSVNLVIGDENRCLQKQKTAGEESGADDDKLQIEKFSLSPSLSFMLSFYTRLQTISIGPDDGDDCWEGRSSSVGSPEVKKALSVPDRSLNDDLSQID